MDDAVCIVGAIHHFAQSCSVDVRNIGDVPIITGPPETGPNLMIELMNGGHSDCRRVQVAAQTQEIGRFMLSNGFGILVLSKPLLRKFVDFLAFKSNRCSRTDPRRLESAHPTCARFRAS